MAIPEMTPVQSSNIAAIGHGDGGLYVQFHTGSVYRYPTCDRQHHNELLAAVSVGSHFQRNIRPAHKGERVL